MSLVLRRKWRKDTANGGPRFSTKANMHATKEISDQEQMAPSSSSRENEQDDMDTVICPVFIKDIAKAILSAGKSLQLVRHGENGGIVTSGSRKFSELYGFKAQKDIDYGSLSSERKDQLAVRSDFSRHYSFSEILFYEGKGKSDQTCKVSNLCFHEHAHSRLMGVLTLPEAFLVSLAGLLGDNDHIYEHFRMSSPEINDIHKSCKLKDNIDDINEKKKLIRYDKVWLKFLAEVYLERGCRDSIEDGTEKIQKHHFEGNLYVLNPSFLGNPVTTVSRQLLKNNMDSWKDLNVSKNLFLPPINDEYIRNAIFCDKDSELGPGKDPNEEIASRLIGTNYTSGFQFDEIELLRSEDEIKAMQNLYTFPTLLPCLEENTPVSELLPFQRNSTLALRILTWIRSNRFKDPVQPAVIVQECIAVYVKEQVDKVGKHILMKLMSDWKLLDELGVLRAIFLLGSGDLLQQFLIVIFNKLDKGDTWDDDFELNAILQESIRNSADGELLFAPDSLVISLAKYNSPDTVEAEGGNASTPRKVRSQCFGIDSLDMLKFTYKVSWPLDLIVNLDALNKYNQVMSFLLKVKRAKFSLDKTRNWTWKSKCTKAHNHKRHLLVQLKLLHFVDAFHQYVMDRVLHNAWNGLFCGMASAGSLDAVIEAHEAYLLSIQRQCFVAPDKLWALIASRIKTILGLALDFYSIQQTLNSGGAAAAIKARCEMELDRIEKQFDDCIAFLLRILSFKLNVGHFPHLADLVTRINYYYFYMSDSGNLLTVPSFEATAKARKISAFRAN